MDISEIKSYMKSHKITYEDLSASSGIPLSTLKSIFCGRTPNPRIDTIKSIQHALGIEKEPTAITKGSKEYYREMLHSVGITDEMANQLSSEDLENIRTLLRTYIDGVLKRK